MRTLDIPLHWQCWKLDSPMVARITDAVDSAAGSSAGRQAPGPPPTIISVGGSPSHLCQLNHDDSSSCHDGWATSRSGVTTL
jgi:hypothetical protein